MPSPSPSPADDYPYTGQEYPDRTAGMLVLEAARIALDDPITVLGEEFGIEFDPDDPSPTYTLDLGFDMDVEATIHPDKLPIHSTFDIRLVRLKDRGSTLRYLGDSRQKPLSLVTGEFAIAVHDASEGPESGYGVDKSPERAAPDDAFRARSFGPHHEVQLADVEWELQQDNIDTVRSEHFE